MKTSQKEKPGYNSIETQQT